MKLFGRLLLWFLAANAVTAAVALLLGGWYVKFLYSQDDAVRDGNAAAAVYESDGGEGLRHWLFQQRLRNGVMGMLRTAEGMPLERPRLALRTEEGNVMGFSTSAGPAFAQALPPPPLPPPGTQAPMAGAVHVQMRSDEGPSFTFMAGEPATTFKLSMRSADIVSASGKHYLWTGSKVPAQGYTALDGLLRVLISLLVIGAAAWLAARRILQPIGELERTSLRLANGDLGARVQRSVTGREDELGSLGSAFNDMAARISKLVDSHRQLLRDVSHELRTPLARLRIAAELARERGEARHFERIEQELELLATLIQRVLLLARLDDPQAGGAEGGSRFALQRLLADICAEARIEAQQRQVEIRCQPAAADLAEAQLRGSVATLRSAFENILRNAVRYTPTGSAVDVRLSRRGQELCVEICDSGPGVPEEALSAIFQPFVRVSDARDRNDQADSGFGLGLTIAHAAVRAHGGAIRARNRGSGGLCVEVCLPQTP